MKLISSHPKSSGLTVFTFAHNIKGENVEITVMAMNENKARPKAFRRATELYKEKKQNGKIISSDVKKPIITESGKVEEPVQTL